MQNHNSPLTLTPPPRHRPHRPHSPISPRLNTTETQEVHSTLKIHYSYIDVKNDLQTGNATATGNATLKSTPGRFRRQLRLLQKLDNDLYETLLNFLAQKGDDLLVISTETTNCYLGMACTQ